MFPPEAQQSSAMIHPPFSVSAGPADILRSRFDCLYVGGKDHLLRISYIVPLPDKLITLLLGRDGDLLKPQIGQDLFHLTG
jgi:hypothetical protein